MRVLIYPFNEDFEPFIKYGMFMGNMEITESLSPSGWGLQDKVIAEKIVNKHDIKEVLWNNVDALLLIDSEVIGLTDQEILEVILVSAQNGKKIIVNRNLNENMFHNISDICKKENVELIIFGNISENSKSIGKHNKAIIGILDKNLANSLQKVIHGGEEFGKN